MPIYFHGLVLLLCIFYGLVFPLAKETLHYAPPLFITGTRMLLAGGSLLLYLYFFDRKQFRLKLAHILPLAVIGVTGVYLTNVLEFWGLQYMESGRACFLYSFSPIVTALISYFWLKESLNLRKCLGLGLGVLGFIPLLYNDPQVERLANPHFLISLSEAALLGAAVTTSIGWTYMRVSVKDLKLPPVITNATSMCIGGGCALVHSLISDPWHPWPVTDFSLPFMGWFIVLMLVSNILCYNLHSYLLGHFSATYIAFACLSCPFFAALFGYFFHHETMSASFWVSFGLVSLGLYLYYSEELKR